MRINPYQKWYLKLRKPRLVVFDGNLKDAREMLDKNDMVAFDILKQVIINKLVKAT